MRVTKSKAGAMQMVVFVAAIIAILLLSFVLLNYVHITFSKKTARMIDLIERANLIVQLHLLNKDSKLKETLNWLEEDGIKSEINSGQWGVFGLLQVNTSFRRERYTKIVLTGGMLEKETALFLQDKDHPLILVGNSKIIGDAYLPRRGFREGSIAGESHYGNVTLSGRSEVSTAMLPKFGFDIFNEVMNLKALANKNSSQIKESDTIRHLFNSFKNPAMVIESDLAGLKNKSFSGNILIFNNQEIEIDSTVQLNDVILVAPKITLKEGVKGSFQAIATTTINVENNCHLDYPSALLLLKNTDTFYDIPSDRNPQNSNITIENHSTVNGFVGAFENSYSNKESHHSLIKLSRLATVNGQVYCEKDLELLGSVSGNVTTGSFISKVQGNLYLNHLYHGAINAELLTTEFVGPLMENSKKKGLVKWLY